MPVGEHFASAGEKVMRSMRKTYPTKKKAKQVFYATENARKSGFPTSSRRRKQRRARSNPHSY
ncbi:MAG: hypothetical protein V3S55_08355 [Nitrospiraceae bacterium]